MNFLGRIDKRIVALVSVLAALLTFVVGLLTVINGTEGSGVGGFLNSLILTVLFGVLGYFIYTNDKEKTTILFIILIGDLVLSGLGLAINEFVEAGQINKFIKQGYGDVDMKTGLVALIFGGIASLLLFIGSALQLLFIFVKKISTDLFKLIATISYLAGAVFAFISAILFMCVRNSDGASIAILLIGNIVLILEAFILSTLLYKKD